MAGDDTAFFRFDSNAREVAQDIAGAMSSINNSLSRPLTQGQLASDTAGFGQMFSRLQGDLDKAKGEVQRLMTDLSRGVINPQEFRAGFQDTVRRAIGTLPVTMAEQIGLARDTTALRQPVQQIAQQVGRDFASTLVGEVRSRRGEVGDALNGVRFDARTFNRDIDAMSRNGLDFASDKLDQIARLRAQIRAENIIARDPVGSLDDSSGVSDRLRRAGYSRDYIDSLVDRTVTETEQGATFRPTDARAELKELQDERVKAEQASRRLENQNEQERISAEKLNRANGELAAGYDRAGSRVVRPDGSVSRITSTGNVDELNPFNEQDARDRVARYDEEVRNGKRLADNFKQAVDVGGYTVLEKEVYRLNQHGAQRITNEYTVKKILEQQDAILTNQALKTNRLREFNGRQVIRSEQNQSGVLGGFLGRFHRGEQSIGTGFGGQLASAAAFSVAYGSLFALQQAVRDTLNEVVDYQDSLTDLEVATRSVDAVSSDWINSLSEMSRLTGANMGAALDTAARGVRAFGDVAGSTVDELEDIGSATNEAATKLALIANKDLKDATGDTISVGTAFGLEPDQLNQVVDAVANAKRSLGGDPAQIAQGLSSIAGTAQEAGYSLNEAAAIMSLVQARTDQSGQTIATRLSRIFQIISGTTGKGLARELGLDVEDLSLKEQIESFAKIYSDPGTSEAVKDRISSGLGGTANLRELLPLLEEQTSLQAAYEEALNNSGQGTDEFNRKSENLVGTLKKITGTIKNIQVDLARSGIFAPVGALLETLEPALNGFDQLLRAYNGLTEQIPYMQELLAVTAEFLLVAKGIGVVQATNTGLFGFGKRAAAKEVGEEAAETAAAAAAGGAAAKGTVGSGLTTIGKGLLNKGTLIGGAALTVLITADQVTTTSQQRDALIDDSNSALQAFTRIDGSAESIRKAAEDLRAGAGDILKTTADGEPNEQARASSARQLRVEARTLDALAERVAMEERAAAASEDATVFGNGAVETVQQLGAGMAALASQGKNALTALDVLLSKGLASEPPEDASSLLQPAKLTTSIVAAIQASLAKAVPAEGVLFDLNTYRKGPQVGFEAPDPSAAFSTLVDQDEAIAKIKAGVDSGSLVEAIQAKMAELGLDQGDLITPLQQQELLNAAVDSLDLGTIVNAKDLIRNNINRAAGEALGLDQTGYTINDLLAGQSTRGIVPTTGGGRQRLLNGTGDLDQDQVLSLFERTEDGTWAGIMAYYEQAIAAIPDSDDGTVLRATQRKFLAALKRVEGRYKDGPKIDVLIDALSAVDRDVRLSVEERLETARKIEQSAEGLSKRQIRSIGRKYLAKRIDNAGTDVALLIDIMESANQQSLDIVRAQLVKTVEVAKAAGRLYFGTLGAIALMAGPLAELAAFDKALSGAVVGVDPDAGSIGGEGAATYEDPKKKDKEDAAEKAKKTAQEKRNEAADRASAIAEARAARLGGGLAEGRAALVSARARLNAQKKGTTEWYQALAAFYQAQDQMSEAVAAFRFTQDRLRGDITDPVENARDALRDARRRFAIDRRSGSGKDILAEDRLAVKESEASLQNERFNQRLSDAQTAEELGRISFQKYIAYLDSEHDRLSKIKNRTRQQQDQLDTVERAMKEASSSMDAQFNLGNIDTRGLVYKARRYAEEMKVDRDAQQAGRLAQAVEQTVSIQIDGADTAKVRKIIEDYVGGPGKVRTPAPRRRR